MGIADLSFLRRARRAVARSARPAGTPAKPSRDRSGAGIGLALTATFMGILLVRSMADAAEIAAVDKAVAPAEGAHSGPGGDAPSTDGWSSTQTIGASGPLANAGSGSVFAAGAFIDPVALAKMSGDAHFAETASGPFTVAAAEQSIAALPGPSGEASSVEVNIGDMGGLPPLPGLPGGNTGENAGPIGDVVVGGDPDDTIVGSEDNDFLDGNGGDDTISGLGGDDVLEGGTGDDTLDGGADEDDLLGQEGDDVLDGGTGDDDLGGGVGDDQLQGGDGKDDLDGGAGNDMLDGGTSNDDLFGESGDDEIQIDRPGDLVIEDPWGVDFGGNDTLAVAPDFGAQLQKAFPTWAKDGVATFMVGESVLGDVPAGANSVKMQVAPNVENVRLTGAEAHDVVGDKGVNAIEGNDGANMLWGGEGDDQMRGGGGDDRLYGEAGDDLLLGDAGNDWLDGGDGADQLYGGAGDDVFVLGLAEGRSATIFDHEGSNRLLLQGGRAESLSAELTGDDLHLAHDGNEIAVLENYALAPQSFRGIDLGDGKTTPLDGFLAPMEPEEQPLPDLLARFIEPSASDGQVEDTGGMAPGASEPIELAALDDAIALSAQFAGADLWVAGDEPVGEPTRPTEELRQAEGR